jgi:hypothetical protein
MVNNFFLNFIKTKIIKTIINYLWIILIPPILIYIYLIYLSYGQFTNFNIRYKNIMYEPLSSSTKYFSHQILNNFLYEFKGKQKKSSIPNINLFIPKSNLKKLNSNLPHSGFSYVKGLIIDKKKKYEIKFRYKGDHIYHWGYNKKSIRISTKKNNLFFGNKKFNLEVPKGDHLNNLIGYELARSLGLMVPESFLIKVNLNGAYQGLYIYVEQIDESFLRRKNLMPGDIYRGEIIAKDKYLGLPFHEMNLFKNAGLWDKISINNHYHPESRHPLKELIRILNSNIINQDKLHKDLLNLIDINQWAKFSAFETLSSTLHYSKTHNQRLYYDPWRQKFIPLVWDPLSWSTQWEKKIYSEKNEIILTDIYKFLFKNSIFLKERDRIIKDFIENKLDNFLINANNQIDIYNLEAKDDPLLAYPRYHKEYDLDKLTHKFNKYIHTTLNNIKKEVNKNLNINYSFIESGLRFEIPKNTFLEAIKFKIPNTSDRKFKIIYNNLDSINNKINHTNNIHFFKINQNEIEIDIQMYSNNKYIFDKKENRYFVESKNGYFDLVCDCFNTNNFPDKIFVKVNNKFTRANLVKNLKRKHYNNMYLLNYKEDSNKNLYWNDVKIFEGINHFYNPIIIEKGTKILLKPNASIIFHNKVIALGTNKLPIKFTKFDDNSENWGTVAIQGNLASSTKFNNVIFEGGSGYKTNLKEYSGMFSAHDVKNLEIYNSIFLNNSKVDDMVHIVYSTFKFKNLTFKNAFLDALDIDISNGIISNSNFINSGNDAIDLMSSNLELYNNTIKLSKDKGVSVGEKSNLIAANNLLQKNFIGVESKDASIAILFNHTFDNNTQSLNAYKKNWRYGSGGKIFLSKSIIKNNEKYLSKDKYSAINVFDSHYVHKSKKRENINFIKVDNNYKIPQDEKNLLPDKFLIDKNVEKLFLENKVKIIKFTNLSSRGFVNGIFPEI